MRDLSLSGCPFLVRQILAAAIVAWVVMEIRRRERLADGKLWSLYRVSPHSQTATSVCSGFIRLACFCAEQAKDFRLMFGCAYLEYTTEQKCWVWKKSLYLGLSGVIIGFFRNIVVLQVRRAAPSCD